MICILIIFGHYVYWGVNSDQRLHKNVIFTQVDIIIKKTHLNNCLNNSLAGYLLFSHITVCMLNMQSILCKSSPVF